MFKAPLDLETIRKAWAVYPKQSKRRVPIVMFLGILGTAFEAFGIGLVIPVMTTMSKATPGNSVRYFSLFSTYSEFVQLAQWLALRF